MALVLKPPVVIETDADLVRVSRDNPGYQFERETDGTIVVAQRTVRTERKVVKPTDRLRDYRKRVGGKAFDASAGFAVGPAARAYSPDASWVSQARIDGLTQTEQAGFWPLSPEIRRRATLLNWARRPPDSRSILTRSSTPNFPRRSVG